MPSKRSNATQTPSKSTTTQPITPSPPTSTPQSQATTRPPQPATISTPAKNTRSQTTTSSTSSAATSQQALSSILSNYQSSTPQRVKIIDAFLAFLVTLGAVQFIYVVIVGNFPFNAFLSGFSATVGQFVLTVSLRMQTNPANKKGNFDAISDERAFADYVLGSLILHLFCVNFIN